MASCRAVFFHLHAHHAVVCVHTMPSCACTPLHVCAHHAIVYMHTTSCVCTPCCHVHTHHVMCVDTTLSCGCTPCRHVHTTLFCACTPRHCVHTRPLCVRTPRCAHHAMVCISVKSRLQSHVTTHLSQSEGSILSNLSDLLRNCEISPKFFPLFKEQSCYNSSAKNYKKTQNQNLTYWITRKPYGFMQSCSVLLPSQIHMTKFTPHLGYFFQFNQRCGKNKDLHNIYTTCGDNSDLHNAVVKIQIYTMPW